MATNEHIINVPGRIRNSAVDGHVAGAEDIFDDTLEKTQAEINSEQAGINAELYALITSLPVSDGTDVESGEAYIDSTDRCVKVKE